MTPKMRYGILQCCMAAVACVAVLLLSHCSSPMAGGGTRGGNPVVTGMIVDADGKAAGAVRVSFIAADLDPVTGSLSETTLADTTDSLGIYNIEISDSGRYLYTVEAVELSHGTRAIRFDVAAVEDSVVELPADTLREPGAISLIVPGGTDTANGYVYVPGTSIATVFSGNRDTIRIDSVPAAVLPELVYVQQEDGTKDVLRSDVAVKPGETTLIVSSQWSDSRRIVLNTSPSGADVSGDVYDFPVLIRLDGEHFDFSEAAEDGDDIMFTGRGNIRLDHEIERWDALTGKAEVWVTVDTVFGDDSTQSIMMYWGAAEGGSTPVSGGVFGTGNGFQGVWHLGENAGDATENGFDGESPDTATPQVAEGVIGNCRMFDGVDDFITIPNSADGALDFAEKSEYTVYAWVALDTLDNVSHCIVSKGYEQYYLRFTYISTSLPSTEPLWEFVEFSETDKWQASNGPALAGEWMQLVGVRQGGRQLFYCNGELIDSTVDVWINDIARNTANNLMIGRFAQPVTVPIIEGYCHFKGGIDEVRIISAARNADWVRLNYMNQRPDDRLVDFK